jgi:thiosulfate/3-mercaptopyruvate sulfurtransferase
VGEYANPEMLVDGAWLQARLGDADVRVVDCDGAVAYRRAHIPGAVFSEVHPYKSAANHRLVMEPEEFAAAMSALGVGPETTVVAYDSNGAVSAGRLWWCLNYYGHSNVRVLDEGWARWLAEGRPITMAESKPAPATFTARADESQLATADFVREAISNPNVVILDVRSDGEWDGSESRGNPRAGHIPGAVHLENKLMMSPDAAETFKDPEALRQLFESCGITPDKEVITL